MTTEKTSFQIEMRYDEASASTAEMQALADELTKRGHAVTLRCEHARTSFVQDLARGASDIREMASTLYGAVENGLQRISSMARDPLGIKAAEEAKKAEAAAPANDGFDDIGPAATAAAKAASSSAVIVTSPEYLNNVASDDMRIGLIPKTSLDRTWQPAQLDAMVIPHGAFRPYLEYIHWDAKRIFEGGYLALDQDKPSVSHDEALAKFKLSADLGPIVVVMTSGIQATDLQNLMVQISLIKAPMQVFFHHAGDAYKADQLRMLAQKYGVNARMFGRVSALPDYIAMADLVVASAADENVSLVETAGVPAVYIASQNTPALVNFLAHESAAVMAPQVMQLSASLAAPVVDAATRAALSQNAQAISKFASIPLCADAIEAALASKNDLMPQDGRKAATIDGFETIGAQAAPGAGILAPQVAPASPFETIAPTAPADPNAVNPAAAAPVNPNVMNPAIPAPAMNTNVMMPNVAVNPGVIQTTLPAPAPFLTPGVGARSKEELQSEYTRLVMIEKNLDKSLSAASEAVHTWEYRLDLARQNNREDLAASAIAALQSAKAQEMSLLQQKDQIIQEKAVLRQSARLMGGQSGHVDMNVTAAMINDELFGQAAREENKLESAFKSLQNLDALNRLKNNMGR